MLICGHYEAKAYSEKTSSASDEGLRDLENNHENGLRFDTTKPVMIFCQPNAGYYEIMHYDVLK